MSMRWIVRLLAPEVLKSQFGLFGTYARAAQAAQPQHWGGAPGGTGTHQEQRTDKTGRTEMRTVRDAGPPAGAAATPPAAERHAGPILDPAPAPNATQATIFGTWEPPKLAPPPKLTPTAPKAQTCLRCKYPMPKFQAQAGHKVCDSCVRTVDMADHPSFSHAFG